MKESGKFSKLFDQPVKREAEAVSQSPKPAARSKANGKPSGAKRVGRPKGKRSNKDFQSVTLFVQRKTYARVQDELTKHNREQEPKDKRDVSLLVDHLLSIWLKDGGKMEF